jgi:DNA-binding response OmpR family regulator
MNVLIIHRQLSFLERIEEKFSLGGWQVQKVTCGLDALFAARHKQFDLMLCGFDLPKVSGTEVIRSTRLMSVNQKVTVYFLKAGTEREGLVDLGRRLDCSMMDEQEMESFGKMACI